MGREALFGMIVLFWVQLAISRGKGFSRLLREIFQTKLFSISLVINWIFMEIAFVSQCRWKNCLSNILMFARSCSTSPRIYLRNNFQLKNRKLSNRKSHDVTPAKVTFFVNINLRLLVYDVLSVAWHSFRFVDASSNIYIWIKHNETNGGETRGKSEILCDFFGLARGSLLSEAEVTRITEAFSLSKPVKALTAEIKFYFEASKFLHKRFSKISKANSWGSSLKRSFSRRFAAKYLQHPLG